MSQFVKANVNNIVCIAVPTLFCACYIDIRTAQVSPLGYTIHAFFSLCDVQVPNRDDPAIETWRVEIVCRSQEVCLKKEWSIEGRDRVRESCRMTSCLKKLAHCEEVGVAANIRVHCSLCLRETLARMLQLDASLDHSCGSVCSTHPHLRRSCMRTHAPGPTDSC